MGRPSRKLVDDGVYHIICRGHNRYRLFHTSDDYRACKKTIRSYKKIFHFDLFHYCLMPNHIHLLLKVIKGLELPHLMQAINQSYAKYYKKEYGHIGNLFQGRYKSILIEKDPYLMECGRYIERNPLRANIVKDLSGYSFSSYNFYVKGRKDDLINPDPLYMALSSGNKTRMRLYSEYIHQLRPYEQILDEKLHI